MLEKVRLERVWRTLVENINPRNRSYLKVVLIQLKPDVELFYYEVLDGVQLQIILLD